MENHFLNANLNQKYLILFKTGFDLSQDNGTQIRCFKKPNTAFHKNHAESKMTQNVWIRYSTKCNTKINDVP